MKTTGTHFKYIEWRDTQGLHRDTVHSLMDLNFLRDELQFLKDLVAEHTLELIYGQSSDDSKTIFLELMALTKRLEKILTDLTQHGTNLQILLDDDDVPGELKEYKDEHYRLMLEEMDFHSDIKKTKRMIFSMLSEIMKLSKQKKLS